MGAHILIVDDDSDSGRAAERILASVGHEVKSVPSGAAALASLENGSFDLVLSDVEMPEMDGLELLTRIKQKLPWQAVVMMSGFGTIDVAVEAVRRGAIDFVSKPLEMERLQLSIANALKVIRLEGVNDHLLREAGTRRRLVGESQAMLKLRSLLSLVAPTSSRVLIQGENGTGKELIANAIHQSSQRSERPFVKVNCGALPAALVESELFGHERGAFTGASQLRKGRFELADGGTLFLDEVGEMPAEAQVKLLRCIQEGEFERVGGTRTLRVDVRVIAATNRDLATMVQAGTFREDLYYRLNVVSVWAPPLRDRREDIPLLVESMLADISPTERPIVTPEALETLRSLPFPGNVRELQNVVERLSIFYPRGVVTSSIVQDVAQPLPRERSPNPVTTSGPTVYRRGVSYRERLLELEEVLLREALLEHDDNKVATAEALGTDKSFLYRKCRQFGLG